jgi:hypothetical protein
MITKTIQSNCQIKPSLRSFISCAAAYWLSQIILKNVSMKQLTLNLTAEVYGNRWNTHEDKNHLLLLWQCVLNYALFFQVYFHKPSSS